MFFQLETCNLHISYFFQITILQIHISTAVGSKITASYFSLDLFGEFRDGLFLDHLSKLTIITSIISATDLPSISTHSPNWSTAAPQTPIQRDCDYILIPVSIDNISTAHPTASDATPATQLSLGPKPSIKNLV